MKIDPNRLAFDIDGVLADTMTLFLDIARDEFGINGIAYTDITCYELQACLNIEPDVLDAIIERLLNGQHAAALKPIDGAADVLQRLAQVRKPLLFVTARPYVGPIGTWILETFGLAPDTIMIEATGSFAAKAEVLRQHGMRHFVEDRLETCFDLHQVGLEPIVFRQPWNRQPHPFTEVGDWRELESLIKFNN
jgi:uncharacterized HAD superfamily protein